LCTCKAKLANAVCILGSATPSIETYYNSLHGKHELLKLTHRPGISVIPEIHVINMADKSTKPPITFD